MFTYRAPNPYPETGLSLSLRLFSSGQSIGKLVLPAQWREPVNLSEDKLAQFALTHRLNIQGGYIGTHDDAVLDTIELRPLSELSKPLSEQHFIVKFNGNGMQYQDALRNFAYDANALRVCVVGFNYRGVGNSKKTPDTFRDLITDGIAQVQRLLDAGADPEKITLDGLSLGGGVATMVAAHFHGIGQPVFLWNDRSFASISKAAAGMVAPESRGIFGDVLATSFETSSWSVLEPAGWDAKVADAYNTIPERYKGYMYVAQNSKQSFGDGVIAHRASLHKGVKSYEKDRGFKTGHKVFASHPIFGAGHNMQRSDLTSAENVTRTGQHVYEDFIRSQTAPNRG